MSRWLRNACLVGVGLREVVGIEPRHGGKPADVLAVASLDPAISGGMPEVRNWGAPLATVMADLARKVKTVDVSVADDWVRYWRVEAPDGLGGMGELRALAQSRFEELFGATSADWVVEADWQASGSMLASAMPRELVEALRSSAEACGLTLRTVAPAAVRWFNRHADGMVTDCWFCSFGERSVCAVLFEGGHVVHVRQFRFDQKPDTTEMLARLESESLRVGLPQPRHAYFAGQTQMKGEGEVGSFKLKVLGRFDAMPELRPRSGQGVTAEASLLAFSGWVK